MRTRPFTTLPFLAALLIGLASMGLSVYDLHQRQVGVLDVGHRATRATADLVTPERPAVLASFLERLRLRFGDERGEIATELLVPVAGIKALKQRAADLVGAMKQVQGRLGDPKLAADAPEREALKADLKQLVTLAEANREDLTIAEQAAEFERHLSPVRDPDAEASRRAAAAGHIDVRDRAQDDPRRGFASHTDQLRAIMRASMDGVVDPRLRPLAAAGGDEQGGHTNPHGGFLLAPAFSPDLLSVRAEVDPIGGRVRAVPMEADRVVFNARVDKNHNTSVSGGLTVSRVPQTVAATASRMEFEQVELVGHDLCGAAYATNRILRTSPISFLALLQSGFRDEFSATLIDERLNGDGIMQYEGIIAADCTIAVAKETGQKADTIVFENINAMRARQWRYGDSIWLANNDTYPQVSTLYMPIGTSGERVRIYEPGSEDAPQGRLLGRPIFFTEFCQKLGDKGDIVNAVWSEFLEGTVMGGVEQSSSIHVRFLNREETFLFVVVNAGRPWWRSALTPKYSAQTLSPFVTLAARA